MNLRKNLRQMCLLVCIFISIKELRAMNELSCCGIVVDQVTKLCEDPSMARKYKDGLEIEYQTYRDNWRKYPNHLNTHWMALSVTKLSMFDQLYASNSFHEAEKRVEQYVTDQMYLDDKVYRSWMADKVMITKEVEYARGVAFLRSVCLNVNDEQDLENQRLMGDKTKKD